MATATGAIPWQRPTFGDILPHTVLGGVIGGAGFGFLATIDTILSVAGRATVPGLVAAAALGAGVGWWWGGRFAAAGRVLATLLAALAAAPLGAALWFCLFALRDSFPTGVAADTFVGVLAIVIFAGIIGALAGAALGVPLGLLTGIIFILVATLRRERDRAVPWLCAALLAPCACATSYAALHLLVPELLDATDRALALVAIPGLLATIFAWCVTSWLASEV